MSVFWNERVRALTPYTAGEQPRDRAFIKLNTNENPYPPSPAVFDALREAATEHLRRYPDPASCQLRDALAQKHGLERENIFCGNGSDEILAFAFGAFFGNAAPVLFPDVTYSFYPVYAKLWNTPFREVPLTTDWNINIDDYRECAGGVIFPNPNAPTGCATALSALEMLTAAALSAQRVVIIDEAYSAFADEDIMPLITSGKYPNLLSVRTFSKAYSLAGLRAGYALGHRGLITALERIRDSFNSYTLDSLAQAAARAAVNDEAYFTMTKNKIIEARERVSAALRARGFELPPSSANFIFARHPSLSGADFYATLRERGILVRYFSHPRTKQFVRITIGTDAEMDALLAACPP